MSVLRMLELYPAFGFDKVPCINDQRWEVAAAQRETYLTSHGEDDSTFRFYKNEGMSANLISKFLGYIPLVNVIVGFARIFFIANAFHSTENPVKIRAMKSHIYRGVAEILFGPLLLIVDIIQTIRDQQVVSRYTRGSVW